MYIYLPTIFTFFFPSKTRRLPSVSMYSTARSHEQSMQQRCRVDKLWRLNSQGYSFGCLCSLAWYHKFGNLLRTQASRYHQSTIVRFCRMSCRLFSVPCFLFSHVSMFFLQVLKLCVSRFESDKTFDIAIHSSTFISNFFTATAGGAQ